MAHILASVLAPGSIEMGNTAPACQLSMGSTLALPEITVRYVVTKAECKNEHVGGDGMIFFFLVLNI